ncbi:hypothetical protein ACEWY4_001734 [Coilia grayii]|uniref:Coiled-coil domain-containing protein 136 n=1 Tax=Coilia grayii TaxID=363190 RepID=A0ABD1KTT8_9TELE
MWPKFKTSDSTKDRTDDLCELKAERPGVEALTAKERESLEENEEKEVEKEVAVGNGEKGQKEEREGEMAKEGAAQEEAEEEEEEEEERGMTEEEELEELRAQVLQLLQELEDTREISQHHEDSFMELQGLLEDERLASAHQAETFTRQIQRLQAQLRSVQEEMECLEEEKESELAEAQEELRRAQEEEELCRLRAQMERLQVTTQDYEMEITSLRAEMAMKSHHGTPSPERAYAHGEVDQLKAECHVLMEECQTLKDDNRQLTEKLHLLQQKASSSDPYLSLRASDEMNTGPSASEAPLEACKAGGYMTMMAPPGHSAHGGVDTGVGKGPLAEGPPVVPGGGAEGVEVSTLRDQLEQAEERANQVQRQCENLKEELEELQGLYDNSQKERAELEAELQHCRAELERLTGKKTQSSSPPSESPILSIPFLGVVVIMALLWCWWSELAS